jgi:hypothetical protein
MVSISLSPTMEQWQVASVEWRVTNQRRAAGGEQVRSAKWLGRAPQNGQNGRCPSRPGGGREKPSSKATMSRRINKMCMGGSDHRLAAGRSGSEKACGMGEWAAEHGRFAAWRRFLPSAMPLRGRGPRWRLGLPIGPGAAASDGRIQKRSRNVSENKADRYLSSPVRNAGGWREARDERPVARGSGWATMFPIIGR